MCLGKGESAWQARQNDSEGKMLGTAEEGAWWSPLKQSPILNPRRSGSTSSAPGTALPELMTQPLCRSWMPGGQGMQGVGLGEEEKENGSIVKACIHAAMWRTHRSCCFCCMLTRAQAGSLLPHLISFFCTPVPALYRCMPAAASQLMPFTFSTFFFASCTRTYCLSWGRQRGHAQVECQRPSPHRATRLAALGEPHRQLARRIVSQSRTKPTRGGHVLVRGGCALLRVRGQRRAGASGWQVKPC